jgi:hypothetical protein
MCVSQITNSGGSFNKTRWNEFVARSVEEAVARCPEKDQVQIREEMNLIFSAYFL